MSGYVPCACRDCMDIAVGDGGWTLCWECLDAGCTPVPGSPAEPVGSDYECQREDAYSN